MRISDWSSDVCSSDLPCDGLAGRSIDWPRGRVLGGSSSINGLIYIRGQREDFDHWRQLGNAGWSYEDVLPYFKRAECYEGGEDEIHGGNGPLRVSTARARLALGDMFIEAAENSGIPRQSDFNRRDQTGVGLLRTAKRRVGKECGSKCKTRGGP